MKNNSNQIGLFAVIVLTLLIALPFGVALTSGGGSGYSLVGLNVNPISIWLKTNGIDIPIVNLAVLICSCVSFNALAFSVLRRSWKRIDEMPDLVAISTIAISILEVIIF